MTSFRGGKPSRLIPRSFIFFVICSSQNPASETLNLACANQALYFLENARKAHIQFLDPNRHDVNTTLKVGLGICRTNADSPWNPVYNVFYRLFFCGNKTIGRQFCKRDLDAANLRPSLEQDCRKQTPSARKLSFRANLLYVPNIEMQRRSRSRSVHNFGTCVWRTAAQWRLPKKNMFRRRKNRVLPLRFQFAKWESLLYKTRAYLSFDQLFE